MKPLWRIGPATLIALLAGTGSAAERVPSLKPAILQVGAFKTALENRYFRKAMRAADRGEWDAVRSYRAGVNTAAARKLLLWRLATGDKDASFFERKEAVETLKGWPRHQKLRAMAEKNITDSGMNGAHIIQYFDSYPPLTGRGKLAFAQALQAGGFAEETRAQIRSAWWQNQLDKKTEHTIEKSFGHLLDAKDDEARADAMIWQRHSHAARRMLRRLKGSQKALIAARLKLMRNASGIDRAVRRVPANLSDNPGLLYERARWRRRHGHADDARELVLHFPEGSHNALAARRMWVERRLAALRAIKAGAYADAYTLVAHNGLSRGGDFARAEWLSGWLALRKLHDARRALEHFKRLKAGVSTPVSLARACYWIGETEHKLGETDAAEAAWRQAARYDFTYYGQLAAQHYHDMQLDLRHDPAPTPAQRSRFTGNALVQALNLVAATGNDQLYRTFSYFLDGVLPHAVDHVMLAKMGRQLGQDRAAMRAAKAALRRGEVLADSAWPVFSLPEGLPVEPALTMALARQESELDAHVVSPVGARGLMQLMPATARRTARAADMHYRKSWLTDDPQYNIRLGTAHLQNLLDAFDGSYILAIAAYNAGNTRARQWIETYGDPREAVDPVDWVESIPFSETRNYVQRVMENVQVYRQRLAGQPIPFSLRDDLERGRKS